VFSNTFGATTIAVFEEFDSSDQLAYMDLQELTDFIIQKRKNCFNDSDAVAKTIQIAARSSY